MRATAVFHGPLSMFMCVCTSQGHGDKTALCGQPQDRIVAAAAVMVVELSVLLPPSFPSPACFFANSIACTHTHTSINKSYDASEG